MQHCGATLHRGGDPAGVVVHLDLAVPGAELAQDLARHAEFQHWITDMHSPGLLRMMQRTTGKHLSQVGATFKFGPPEGPPFFERYGWKVEEVRGLLKTAGSHRRLPVVLKVLSLLPENSGAQGSRPWSGVCLFERKG